MALGATLHHVEIALSDVDRGVYETLDVRLAQHPSESMRFLATRMLAYALAYEEGIAFSKGGISSTDEPALSVRDRTGLLLAWIEIGAPSADRLHRASKAAPRVALYTSTELAQLRREAGQRAIHKVEAIDVFRFEPGFLDAVVARMARTTKVELTRTGDQLYVGIGGATLEAPLARASLVAS